MKPLAYTLTVLALIAGITLAAAPQSSSAQTSESTSDPTADINSDGIVNSLDFSILNRNWST